MQVARVLKLGERFAETLEQGMRILEGTVRHWQEIRFSGAWCSKLYDTYGFPTDLVADIARERDLTLDMEGFEKRWKCSERGHVPPATSGGCRHSGGPQRVNRFHRLRPAVGPFYRACDFA